MFEIIEEEEERVEERKGILASELLRREESSMAFRPIPTFVQELDICLGGGIKPGMITEFVGDAGIGKTTLCIQLCINVQTPVTLQGLQGEAVFIDTENSFVGSRAQAMARGFVKHCNDIIYRGSKGRSQLSSLSVQSVMKGIHVIKCMKLGLLEKVLLSLEKLLTSNRKIRLIVIDSIAFPCYSVKEGFAGRSQLLYEIGQILHYLAGRYDIPIVIINSLTTRFDRHGAPYYVPFLGDTWQNIPNQRIQLEFKDGVRTAQILKSPCVACSEVDFKVTGDGIRGNELLKH